MPFGEISKDSTDGEKLLLLSTRRAQAGRLSGSAEPASRVVGLSQTLASQPAALYYFYSIAAAKPQK